MSGLSRTPGKRVWVNSPPRVRIPLAPPKQKPLLDSAGAFSFMPLRSARQLNRARLTTYLDPSKRLVASPAP